MGLAERILAHARLRRFLFAPVDARAAALLRIHLAALVAIVFWPRGGETPSSVVAALGFGPELAAWVYGGGYWGCILVLLAGFALGLSARGFGLPAALLLAALVPVDRRLPGRFVTWFAFAVFALLRSDLRLRPLGRRTAGAGAVVAGPIWPIRLIQVQLSILYGVNALAKTTKAYLGGEALKAMSTELPNFRVDLSDGVFPLFGFAIPLTIAAIASAACEYALALGFWFRSTRWAAALLGVAFHLGLLFVVHIGRLDVAAVGLYAAFLLPLERRESAPE